MTRKYVGLDERGHRCAESHHRAKLSDHDVDLIRELQEKHGLSLREIAEKFGCGKSTVRDMVKYRRRTAYPVRWVRVKEEARP